ncbi:MAG: WG repeat-containing protein [Bacillota bacterium]|nr:WG repeat-containing protein [Bacillota bacterium]
MFIFNCEDNSLGKFFKDKINIESYNNNLIAFSDGEKWGVVDLGGNEIISRIYDEIKYILNEDMLIIRNNDKYEMIKLNEND